MPEILDDGLIVKKWGDGYGVWDTLTEKFVSSKRKSRHWLQVDLDGTRSRYRPLITRFIYGLSTTESKAFGITERNIRVTT
jgi:hypothetical protein